MLLAASGALAAAVGVGTCPSPAAILLTVLEAFVVVVSLRAPWKAALPASLVAAVAFLPLRLGASVVAADPDAALAGLPAALGSPALLDLAGWTSALLGAVILVGSSGIALWCSQALESTAVVASGLHRRPAARGAEVVGRARADWLLAEARRGRRLVTLALVGVDAPADFELEPGQREATMLQLDEVLRTGVTGVEVVSEYGPWERLLVLPDVWAEDFRDQAVNLVKAARQRVRRQVRCALITFPLDDPGAGEPLEYLERALEVCRAGRTSVSVGRPRIRRMTPNHEIA
jgi:hypothetical protein